MSDSEYREVDDYVTSESESEDEVQESNKKKRTRKNWIYERTFDDQEASKDCLDNEKIWSFLKSSETEAGLRVDYRCNLVKRKGPQCAAAIYLLHKSENLSVALFKERINTIIFFKDHIFLKRKITEVEEETPQETVIPTKKNKKTIDNEDEKVVQASTSSDISKKVEAPLKRGRGRPRKNL
ncbi:hypothetical protein BpHYR1_022888 [Brachionus plicatilis]|uniref:Uncharacterized protein n=1 Tax=Brachionus plicatilis TaxID=10195 RepID=A0A3M7SGS8_BRAPC|nr:hypothetical protein BpHYR1_022888 [Brachionus plicatilis]